jgi:hypothetical protein
MPDQERTEKVRQEVMRLNELLGIMRRKLADGELAYAELFASFTSDESATMNHKDLQWKLAEQMDDLSPLKQIVSKMRFDARELEKAFAELYDIVAMTPDVVE